MEIIRGFLLLLFLLLLRINTSNSHCTACEKVSLSLNTNVKRNFSLVGYVLQNMSSLRDWKQCSNVCLKNCQCLSFNFNDVNTTANCELNDANTKVEPEALREKEGVSYYELARSYYDMKVRKCSIWQGCSAMKRKIPLTRSEFCKILFYFVKQNFFTFMFCVQFQLNALQT